MYYIAEFMHAKATFAHQWLLKLTTTKEKRIACREELVYLLFIISQRFLFNLFVGFVRVKILSWVGQAEMITVPRFGEILRYQYFLSSFFLSPPHQKNVKS